MDYEPLNEWLLVKRMDEEVSKASGIIIPDQFQRPSNRGMVVGIGSEVRIPVNEGDMVLFSEYSNMPIELDGQEYLLVRAIDTFLRKKVNAPINKERALVLSEGISSQGF